MAKKQQRRPTRRRRPAPVRPAVPPAPSPAPRLAPAAPPDAPAARVAPTDLSGEYRYVIADLKRIGIVAASMFTLLVVLALIIT